MPEPFVRFLCERYPNYVEQMPTPFEIPQVRVDPDGLLEVASWLREDGFDLLLDVGGVDYLPRRPRFEVVYHVLDTAALRRIRLRVSPKDDEKPEVPSVASLWPAAAAAEREVYDLFGITFSGHPNLTRILMPDDWDGHPLRKDYPLQGPRGAAERPTPARQGRFHAPKLEKVGGEADGNA